MATSEADRLRTKAVIYPRVSSMRQADGCSLDDQEKHGRAYCERMGFEVVEIIPETYSGYDTLDVRPGLRQVRDMLRRGEAQALVFWRVDRMGREILDNLLLHREVYDAGGELHSTVEGFIPNTPMGKTQLTLHSFAGETEYNAIIARTQGALRTRAESGKLLIGRSPKFGYTYVGERKASYAIDEKTGPMVERIFTMAHDGQSLHTIAKTLNAEGVPTPTIMLERRGLPVKRVTAAWSRQMLYQLLRDSSYCGRHPVYNRQQVKRRVQNEAGQTVIRKVMQLRSEGDAKRLEQTIPAIVSEAVWAKVQTNIKDRSLRNGGPNQDPSATLLNRGIAYCGHCGHRVISAKHHAGYRMYQCSHKPASVDDPSQACSGGSWAIKAADVDNGIWAKIEEMGHDLDHVRRMIDKRRDATARNLANVERDKATIAAERRECEQQLALLQKRMGTETDEFLYANLREQMLRVRDTLKSLDVRDERIQDRKDFATAFLAAFEDVYKSLDMQEQARRDGGKVYTVISRDEKRRLLRALGVKVFIYGSKSEFALANGKRWDFKLEASGSGADSIQE